MLGYGYYWYFYNLTNTFTATITYKLITINESRTIAASTAGDASLKIVKLTSEGSASNSTTTTGEKPTGDKATGNISLFNSTVEIKIIPKGTTLTCISSPCNTLTYITQNDLNLAPGSSDEVSVVAGDIGEGYNLLPGAGRFKVGKFNPEKEITATNVKPISGGTPKKMIKIVAAADIKKAETAALSDIKSELLNKIKTDPANYDKYIVSDSSLVVEKTESTPDVKEGQEAEFVNVDVKAKGTVNAFPKDQIDVVANKIKEEVTPKGYYLDEKFTPSPTSKVVSQTKDKIEVSVTVQSIARPEIDIKKIKEELTGKAYSDADKVLSSIPNITSYKKSFQPTTLPQFFWKIPKEPNRIQIAVVAVE